MRLPKKVYIAGKIWTVIYKKNNGGGEFDGGKCVITVGTKFKNDTFINFLHEVIEAILTERLHRYTNAGQTDYLFSFNHDEFSNVVEDIAGVFRLMREGTP